MLRFGIAVAALSFAVTASAYDPSSGLFHPAGHAAEGLPISAESSTAYFDDPGHPLNRLHRLLFVREFVAEEIQAALPSERAAKATSDDAFFTRGWYFRKRPGTEADRRAFGGDVRVSPVREFTPEERAELLGLLSDLSTRDQVAAVPELRDPLVRLLIQWDLLTMWWRLERAEPQQDDELLVAMARSIAALAQPEKTLRSLPSGLDGLKHTFAGGEATVRNAPYLPADFPPAGDDSEWVEVGRNSSALFQADKSLRASRTYLHADRREDAEAIVAAAATRAPGDPPLELPDGIQTGLVQTLVGIDENLEPVATPVVDEVRVRLARGPFELTAANPSSSRDGSSHWVYLRTREGTRRGEDEAFRFVPDTSQSMFIEYGTLKHATFAAQCALCHRTTNNGGQAPAGIRMLARHAAPHVARADERPRLAEEEAGVVADRLRARLRSEPIVAPKPERLPPRPEQTPEERDARAAALRETYSQPPSQWPAPHVDEGVAWKEIGLLPAIEHPEDNPHSAAKEMLGKQLFFDPRLSGSKQLACASCHDPDLGWADGRTTSFGHSRKVLARNSPSIRHTAFQRQFFWDGRAVSLEDQVEQVLLNPDEMRAEPESVVAELAALPEYQTAFAQSFGGDGVTPERIAQAIACFERTIVGGNSRFDAFLQGDEQALSDAAVRGLDLFRRDARCINCHHGPAFTDGAFHDLGLSYYGRKYEDLGRYRVTGETTDVGRFRTPSLRDVTSTAPYMHNGLFELTGVLNMYNAGMATLRRKPEQADDPLFPTKSPHLKSLGLNRQDLSDLAAFLESLEEPKRRIRPPALPGLHAGR